MPVNTQQLRQLRDLKRLNQGDLYGLKQSQVSDCERRGTNNSYTVEKLADALDCTTDFLLGRTLVDLPLEEAASLMAFDVFVNKLTTTKSQRQRCRRVLGHKSAPVTADGWSWLAEQIELAVPPEDESRTLRAVNGDD